MSVPYIPATDYYSASAPVTYAKLGDWTAGFNERSNLIPLLFIPTIFLGAASWLSNGIQIVNDIAMILFTLVLAGLFIHELLSFPRRFGIGGLIAFGGGLLWWCYDYHKHWLGYQGELTGDLMFMSNNIDSVPAWVLGKAICLHSMFMAGMAVGLLMRKHMWISRLSLKTLEPASPLVLFIVVMIIFGLSLVPYFFTNDGFIEAIRLSIFAGRGGGGPSWTTGRTGNLNYNWGGYLAQLVYLGYACATLAMFHAIMFSRSLIQTIVCVGIFVLQVALAFGTGARGNVVFVCLPLAIIFYLKYNFVAAAIARKFSFRAYVVTLGLLCGMLVVIQVQGEFRNEGFSSESFREVSVAKIRGNEMFTTTLPGMAQFPNIYPHIDEPFPGGGFIYALPKTVYWFCINPIPRALWHDKPTDKAWFLYNSLTTGRAIDEGEGTTISRGAAGDPYFKWGIFGMLQIAVLYGWILRNCEIGMRYATHRVFSMLFLLGTATFIFRAFRDLNFHDYYPVVYGTIMMMFFTYFVNQLVGGTSGQRMELVYR